jgi:predicted RNA-binding protein with PUA-like domain
MTYFLAKTDPDTYPLDQFERDHRTVWDGVRNPQAVRTIQQMQPGDDVLMYHSMTDKAIVGLARVVSEPRPDPDDSKSWVVDMEFVRRFEHAVTLQEIKETHLFDNWSLIRQSRLSITDVPDEVVAWLKEKHVI